MQAPKDSAENAAPVKQASSLETTTESVGSKPPGTTVKSEVREHKGLVRVEDIDESIVIDLRYATGNNFTGQKLYPIAICVLTKETCEKLNSSY